MLGSSAMIPTAKGSTLDAHKPTPNYDYSSAGRSCDNSGAGHRSQPTISNGSWHWKPALERRANAVHSKQPFIKEQLEVLQKLLRHNIPSPNLSIVSTGNMVHGGNLSHALLLQQKLSNSWIVDSGASDHMTGNMDFFQSLSTCTDSHKVE